MVRTVRGLPVILMTGTIGLPMMLPWPVGKRVHDVAGRRHQRHAFGRGRRGVHVIKTGALGRRFGRLEHVDVFAGAADLLEVAERLFLDGGEAAGDVALGRLRFRKIVGLVRLDDVVLVGLPDLHPFLADLRRDGARLGEMLGAGDLRGLAEHAVDALRDQLVVHVADGRAGGEARWWCRSRRIWSRPTGRTMPHSSRFNSEAHCR